MVVILSQEGANSSAALTHTTSLRSIQLDKQATHSIIYQELTVKPIKQVTPGAMSLDLPSSET